MTKKLVIGTRGSKLALIQAQIAEDALKKVAPDILIEQKIITPKGDRDKSSPIPLDSIGKGWFSQEIEQELLSGDIDIAVHSLKDMLTELPQGLTIGAYLPREDARDALLTKHGESLEELKNNPIIGTDSTRRQEQMKALRPDAVMQSLRGNVPNRVEKLHKENYDAIILAAAGLIRLDMQHVITRYFEPDEMTPAPGQGIIAIEIKEGNNELLSLLAKINNADAATAAHIERSFSEKFGGGCKSPTGAYARRGDDEWILIAMIAEDDGTIIRQEMRARHIASEKLGELLAEKMLAARHAHV